MGCMYLISTLPGGFIAWGFPTEILHGIYTFHICFITDINLSGHCNITTLQNAIHNSVHSSGTSLIRPIKTVEAIPVNPERSLRVLADCGSQIAKNRHMKVVRLSVVHTGRLYPQEIFLVLISVRG